jgi:anti-sigma regulatory factor (Ser/Thr protein kinase)
VARHALRDRGVSDDLEHTVALLTSEVVGNAVRHAGQVSDKIVFFARISSEHVHVEVADEGPGFDPDVRHASAGYGLRLMDKLASDWGVQCAGKGCRVWFDLDRRRRRFPRPGAAAAG